MTGNTDRVWAGVHDDAPHDDEGRPIHPEKGYPICAYPKTDAVDRTKDGKREDIPYCLRSAGWGTDRETGHCKTHGGAGGAPEGWANGNASHLLYSKRMNDDDREEFESLVETSDGDRIDVEDAADMLDSMIRFEYMRLARAVDSTPGVEMVQLYECPECGERHRESSGDCDGEIRVDPREIEPCPYRGEYDRIKGKAWVTFGDEAVERKERHIANLIDQYKRVTEGTDINVSGDHDVSVSGDDGDPVEVSITSVGVDLPEDVDDPDDADDGGEE